MLTTVIAVVIGAMAAYAVARLEFPGKRVLIGAVLLISMFPAISLVTPLFNIERRIGLFDTWPGLIIPYITFALPLAIYTLSAFFREIPLDLEKAAKMDGATPAQAFRKVIAPLAAPGIVTTAILVFIFAWNDLLLALSLHRPFPNPHTLAVKLTSAGSHLKTTLTPGLKCRKRPSSKLRWPIQTHCSFSQSPSFQTGMGCTRRAGLPPSPDSNNNAPAC